MAVFALPAVQAVIHFKWCGAWGSPFRTARLPAAPRAPEAYGRCGFLLHALAACCTWLLNSTSAAASTARRLGASLPPPRLQEQLGAPLPAI
jgi:hypothetical protein